MTLRCYDSLESLPSTADALFAAGENQSLCLSKPWFESLARHDLASGDRLLVLVGEDPEGQPGAILPGVQKQRDTDFPGARVFAALSNYFSSDYQPLLAGNSTGLAALQDIFESLRRDAGSFDVLRFRPLLKDSDAYRGLRDALRAAGWRLHPYFHYKNYFEATAGQTAASYLAARPGALREVLRRKSRQLERRGEVAWRTLSTPADLADARQAYWEVYAKSWKKTEPKGPILDDLMELAAGRGALRLGVLTLDKRPLAAQLWLLWQGRATLCKMAHDQDFDAFSPGSLLTAHMAGQMIDQAAARVLDFGVGGDPYKTLWTSESRAYWGLIAFNPGRLLGRLYAGREWLARQVKGHGSDA